MNEGTGTLCQRLRSVLVVAETAIGLMLLVTAGLLLRTFHHLTHDEGGSDDGLRYE